MNYQLRVRPQVESDIDAAAQWYEGQQPGLGIEFVTEIHEAIGRLTVNPLRSPIRHRLYPLRWVFPNRFPYRIVFLVEETVITILCVVHAKRHDRIWKEHLARPDFPPE
ncbi:MAG TPA: type II toxin-antitoxin system RelE/ParE family toxin [Terriglobia bacterium]|nr:type II toxin-antitoxin system RelE/ParE family toxin [Terriglobia bacterium]